MLNTLAINIISPNSLPQTPGSNANISAILSIIFVSIGGLALLMIVIGGLRYILAQGDPSKVAESKNTIIYSLIGLIISASAAAIVNYIVGRL